MGEYADMALDAGFSSWSDEEPDDYIGSFKRRLPKMKTCRRCGETGLHWRETDDGWRLHKWVGVWEDAEHECSTATTEDSVGTKAACRRSDPQNPTKRARQ